MKIKKRGSCNTPSDMDMIIQCDALIDKCIDLERYQSEEQSFTANIQESQS